MEEPDVRRAILAVVRRNKRHLLTLPEIGIKIRRGHPEVTIGQIETAYWQLYLADPPELTLDGEDHLHIPKRKKR